MVFPTSHHLLLLILAIELARQMISLDCLTGTSTILQDGNGKGQAGEREIVHYRVRFSGNTPWKKNSEHGFRFF